MMKAAGKIVLLIMGLLPVIFFSLAFAILGTHFHSTNILLMIGFVISSIAPFIVFVYYVINVIRKKDMIKEVKYLWITVLFFGNILAYPFFWYLHIWKKPVCTPEN